MNRFQKLSSIVFLLLAFLYPPTLVEAKESTQNNVLNEQSIEAETNLVAGESGELLLAHHHRRQHYYGRRRARRYYHGRRRRGHYYRRRNHNRHYYRQYYRHRRSHGRYYRRARYHGQYYRNGGWELVRDRYGRLVYEWRRHH
ncbi:hypothetical protein [Anabaena subtropica]|uniref:Uncharacterized protein n=1 Tax=Anabaena subtropica FACHB-260 TaxID=2692884 RepID=A0ABR8CJD9_9NOST|nr:hypothetical protein [Anabaena subtropica]MBD2342938.1 hypothetical protein [Anabaena subtropica FACHB-260]